ncbi:MAG: copper amine oxidase N-terminal domain-containing protein [Armatimonadota bacterium]
MLTRTTLPALLLTAISGAALLLCASAALAQAPPPPPMTQPPTGAPGAPMMPPTTGMPSAPTPPTAPTMARRAPAAAMAGLLRSAARRRTETTPQMQMPPALLHKLAMQRLAQPQGRGETMLQVVVSGKSIMSKMLANTALVCLEGGALEALGAQGMWDGDARVITIRKGQRTITTKLGGVTMQVDGVPRRLNAPSRNLPSDIPTPGGKIWIPLRPVVEALGGKIVWNKAANIVMVSPY